MPDGGFEPPDADEGVEAGAVGPLVDDAEDRQGVRILNAGGQIALTGHGYDELGAGLHDDAAGDGSPGGDGDLHAVGIPQVEYVLERAGPAAGAVVDVVGKAVGAAARLDAVGQEHEKLARFALDAAAEDQLVVDLDEGTAHGGYGDAHHPAHEFHDRQEQADSDTAQARCAEYGLSGVGMKHQPHGKPKDSEDGPAEDDARDLSRRMVPSTLSLPNSFWMIPTRLPLRLSISFNRMVVLPEPLSPTMPKVSPLYMSKLTPLTALNRCQLLPKVTSRSRTFSSTSLSRVSNCFPSQLLQFADNLGRLHLGGTGVQQPGACPVRRGNIEIRRLPIS